MEFHRLASCNDLNETEEQLIARYVVCLKFLIQEKIPPSQITYTLFFLTISSFSLSVDYEADIYGKVQESILLCFVFSLLCPFYSLC